MDCCSPGDSPFDRQFDVRHAAAVDVDAIVAASGLVKQLHRTTRIWQLVVYERPAA